MPATKADAVWWAGVFGMRDLSSVELHQGRSRAERKSLGRQGRVSFGSFKPRIVPAGTGTLASPRQVAGSPLHVDQEPLLMLGAVYGKAGDCSIGMSDITSENGRRSWRSLQAVGGEKVAGNLLESRIAQGVSVPGGVERRKGGIRWMEFSMTRKSLTEKKTRE